VCGATCGAGCTMQWGALKRPACLASQCVALLMRTAYRRVPCCQQSCLCLKGHTRTHTHAHTHAPEVLMGTYSITCIITASATTNTWGSATSHMMFSARPCRSHGTCSTCRGEGGRGGRVGCEGANAQVQGPTGSCRWASNHLAL